MAITEGDRLPDTTFEMMTPDGKKQLATNDVFAGRRVVLFAVPGAFTGTCSNLHLPGYLREFDALKARGADVVVCTAVNDAAVMHAWEKQTGAEGKIMFLADGNGEFARKLGLDIDLSRSGMGLRSRRYSMLVEDGIVKRLNVEAKPGVNVSGVETILTQL
jgi:glutaredoxin/glutathione-dependent peroxiredoxin